MRRKVEHAVDGENLEMARLSRNPDDDPVIHAIRDGVETRVTEFKESQPFEILKWKLVKACMAMANLRDGGRIIIGCDEREGVPRPSGMSEEHQRSYNQDILLELVNVHARPPVELTVRRVEVDDLRFVGIEVAPFVRTPVMCVQKNHGKNPPKNQELRPAEIYVRSNERVATTKAVTPELLEEMLEIATWKRVGEIISNAQRVGWRLPESDAAQLAREREEFGDF